ncbi:MAG: ATP-dependent nuclease [Acidobacteriota bacterium]
MRITALHAKDGEAIPLGKFTVLVGPNNVGKSQTLRDVQMRMDSGADARTTLITDIDLEKPPAFEGILDGLQVVEDPQRLQMHVVRGIRSNLQSGDVMQVNLENLKRQYDDSPDMRFILGNLARYRVSFLDASSRLAVAQTTGSFNPLEQPPANLLQGLFADEPVEIELRNAFKSAFGMDVKLDYSGMTQLTLRVAREFEPVSDDPRKAFPVMNNYNKLDTQGDGFRSFVGVVLSLLLSRGRIILLDEPEAFLHPAQARTLGRWVAVHSEAVDSQIIIATHNAHFLAGILAQKPDASIFRLNRREDHTSYNPVPAEATERLVKSPILSSQRVMEAFFYKGVAVCEADSDRIIYQTVAVKEFGNENVLFVHAHNKQTVREVVGLLRDATIPVCAITDIDILNSSDELKRLLLALKPDKDFAQPLRMREEIARFVMNRDEKEVVDDITSKIAELFDQLCNNEHGLSGVRGALNRIYGESKKWSPVKKRGVSAFPVNQRATVQTLVDDLVADGLFVVPVGSLEGWLELGSERKNRWIVLALEALNANKCSEGLRKFVSDVLASMDDFARPAEVRVAEAASEAN